MGARATMPGAAAPTAVRGFLDAGPFRRGIGMPGAAAPTAVGGRSRPRAPARAPGRIALAPAR